MAISDFPAAENARILSRRRDDAGHNDAQWMLRRDDAHCPLVAYPGRGAGATAEAGAERDDTYRVPDVRTIAQQRTATSNNCNA